MQFSKTTRFARAQLRPILCIWSVMLPEACTSPAAPLPAPLPAPATPSHTGRPGSQGTCTPSLGPGLGADRSHWKITSAPSSQRVAPVRCRAAQGLNKGQGWAIPARGRVKVVHVQLRLAAPCCCSLKMLQVKGCDLQQLIRLLLQLLLC